MPIHTDADELFDALVEKVAGQIEDAVRDRFGDSVEAVDTKVIENAFGDIEVTVTITINMKTSQKRLHANLFGLTGHVRKAMGAQFRDVFPVILPVAAHTHA